MKTSDTEARGERIAAARRTIRAHSLDGIERRSVPFTAESRATGDGGGWEIRGHAAVFDDLSENLGFFEDWYERIQRGAFAQVLAGNPDVRALVNHDPSLVLARTKSGSLTLAEDDRGLEYRADVPAGLYYGDALRILLDRGDVDQSSFAFRVARKGDSWDEDDDGNLIRTIHRFSGLYDVSPVTYPAYTTTDAGLAGGRTAPTSERVDDEPAGQRGHDDEGEDQQAGQDGYRLALRKRRLSLLVRD